jgi:regulatory protein
LLQELETEGYLDSGRFARTFARGKFHVNKWGKRKIVNEMKARGVPETLIRQGLEEIGVEEYRDTLRDLLIRKAYEIKPGKNLKKREKVINFALGKGFETSLILEILKELNI